MNTNMKTHTINAEGRTIGRVASEAAKILMGKNDPSFERHMITGGLLTIENAGKIRSSTLSTPDTQAVSATSLSVRLSRRRAWRKCSAVQ